MCACAEVRICTYLFLLHTVAFEERVVVVVEEGK